MFTKILVPCDGSPHSHRALQVAADLAKCTQAAIHVVHAYERLPSHLGGSYFRDELRHVLVDAVEIVDGAIALIEDQGIRVTSDVLEGPPAEMILRLADTDQFDLIVMGSRGLGQVEGLLLGSVSDRVLHHAKVPVMIVRQEVSSAASAGPHSNASIGAHSP
jgi:nucleotide-binding universal stress UspA family protein